MVFKSKIFKSLFSIAFILLIILGFSTIRVNATTKNNEETLVCNATLEDDFLDDSIIVVLKNDVSLIFKTYLCEDFNEINCIDIDSFNRILCLIIGNSGKKCYQSN